MAEVIGFIGGGNMGGAIIGGIANAGNVPANNIIVADLSDEALSYLKESYHVTTTHDNLEVAKTADVLFLAVKPHIYPLIIEEIRDSVKENVIIVTIAAGQSLNAVEKMFGRPLKIVRTMPNTPALVGQGITAVAHNSLVSAEELKSITDILSSIGISEIVPENMMDVVTGVSGSSPAYVYMFIEAMSDAVVAEGMPRAQSYRFAAQAVLGAAKMVLETGKHPGELKDMVCSPGGTTIAAVNELEHQGMRGAVIAGIHACINKSRDMSK